MKVAKTIDEIYDDVKGYDVVISNDATLVMALNNRLDVPKIGRLASTPKMIAKDHEYAVLEPLVKKGECVPEGRYGIIDDTRLLSTISEETGYDVRLVHGEVNNIRLIRKYTKDVEKHLFGKYANKVYTEFLRQPTYEMVMSHFEPDNHAVYRGKRVAIIGIELFDDLDKHFIPFDFDEIDIFKEDGRYDISFFYAVGNDRQVAEHAVDLISGKDAEDVAIVMDTAGPIADAVRSALYKKELDFKNVLSARDLISVRDYTEFVKLAMSFDILTIGDVKELFACYNTWTGNLSDKFLLNRHAKSLGPRVEKLSEIMKNIRQYTFERLCDEIVDKKHKGTVMMILKGLGLTHEPIGEKTADSASYLINSMQDIRHNAEMPDSEKRGVLLADCHSSVFIDRPFVIYLNIDSTWSRPSLGKDYIDRLDEEEKNLQKFQILLQQGSARIYLINTVKDGKIARPCPLFDRLNEDDNGSLVKIRLFNDILNASVRKGAWYSQTLTDTETQKHSDAATPELGMFSKTSLNRYISCPRAYMFGELIKPPDEESTVLGNMIHEFAEFYLCYPEVARTNMKECADIISDVCAGISCPERSEVDRSRIRISVMNVARFVDSIGIKGIPLNIDASSKRKMNTFFDRFDMSMTSDIAECDHRSGECPLHGEFDLIVGNKIVDYKTGNPLSVSDISGKMDLRKNNGYFELQPLVYLAILDGLIPGGTKDFILFYVFDNDVEAAMDPEFNVLRNTRTVRLLDVNREDIIRSGMLLDLVTKTKSREFLKDLGNGFSEALLEAGIENADRWPSDEKLIGKISSLLEKSTKKTDEEIRMALKMSSEYVSGCFIKDDGVLIIHRESIERFKEYVRTVHSRAKEQQISDFPCEPRKNCDNCRFLSICTGGRADDAVE